MNKHALLQKYIKGLCEGYSNSLVVSSKAGLGKSSTTINALKQAGLHKDEHYTYVANYLTPKALVALLEATNKLSNPRILVIDEAEMVFSNMETLGILKSALWEVDRERKVFWITSKEHIEFEFTGKIIFILNKVNKKSPIVNAILDRSLFYEMSFNKQDIMALLEQRAEQPYFNLSKENRFKVFNFIKCSASNSDKLSLRTLPKAFQAFLISPNSWQELVAELL